MTFSIMLYCTTRIERVNKVDLINYFEFTYKRYLSIYMKYYVFIVED